MVSMTTVAKHAGVSLATVSHVLNRTRPVSQSTMRQVLDAAHEVGFVDPRLVEVEARTITIGAVVPSVASPYFGELVEGLSAEAARRNIELLLMTSGEDPDREYRAVTSLIRRRVDGIALIPSSGWRAHTRGLLRHGGLPAVIVDRADDGTLDQVVCEGEAASEALVSHLLTRGHRRVGFLRGISGLTTTAERESGYRRAFERHRLPVHEPYVVDGLSTVGGGAAAMEALMLLPEPPTAVFSGNNNMTVGALSTLRRMHVRIPDDLAFVAFDDLEWSDIIEPGLTSMAQPFFAMGVRTLTTLLDRLAAPGSAPTTVQVPPSFEHRASCGCAAA